MNRKLIEMRPFSPALVFLVTLMAGFFSTYINAAEKGPLLKPVYTAEDIDFNASGIFSGKKEVNPTTANVVYRSILGLSTNQKDSYKLSGESDHNETDGPLVLSYMLVFKKELPVGTILADKAEKIHVLKSGITGKISPFKNDIWQDIPKAENTGGRLALSTLPNNTKTKAILFQSTFKPKGRIFPCPYLRVLKERLGNITPLATANAESEYTVYPDMGPPFTFYASHIPQGKGKWVNAGEDKTSGKVPRAPISDIAPCWFILSWEKPQTFQTIYLEDNHQELEFYKYTGAEGINPAVANDREWKKLRDWKRVDFGDHRERRSIITFKEPVTTRGLKYLATKSSGGPVAAINAYHVYQNLGSKPVPKPVVISNEPPYKIPIKAPIEGTMSLVIDDAKGKRVSNLKARVDRTTGELKESWNLRNNANEPVSPGTYKYTALFMPELNLKYQMTPYPNVENNSDNTPWPQGNSGAGAWLADHSGIGCVTVGDNGKIYFGAGCAESGQALAECDLNGAKEWSHHNFVAWTGPSLLAFGDGTLFAASRAHWNLTDHVWAVNAADKTEKTFLAAKGTNRRVRGISGMTYLDGKLYLAINAKADWMANAGDGSDVDSDLCLPRYKVKNKEDRYDPDTRDDFKRLFRLTGTPAGQGNPDEKPGLTYIESTDLPGSRNHVLLVFKSPFNIGSLVFPFPKGGYQMRIKALKKDGAYPPKPNNKKDWIEIYRSRKGTEWQVVTAPKNLSTRALCITYSNSDDDLLEALEGDDEPGDGLDVGMENDGKKDDAMGGGDPWKARLEGMKILRRRYKGVTEGLKVRVNSGAINKLGEWDAKRTKPINEADPGIYLMEWPKEQKLRGLAIKEIDGKSTFIDVYTGPPGKIPLKGNKHWKRVATYEQQLRNFYKPAADGNDRARYIDGYVDFGEEIKTRAVRLSVVEQWTARKEGRAGCEGVREDRGGRELSATRCRVYGVAALSYLGGEVPVDPLTYNRMEIYEAKNGKLLQEIAADKTGKLTVDNKGRIYAQLDNKIAILQDNNTWKIHISDVLKPSGMGTDKAGNLYVFDGDLSRKQVRVYDPSGKFTRTIGKVGGYKQGPFDPEYITASGRNESTDMAIDGNGKLWITQSTRGLKRISRWTTAGVWEKDFYGNTSYGGGGVLDITNTERLFYADENDKMTVEFGLDWKTGKTKINTIAWIGDSPGGEYVIPVKGRNYLVSRPLFGRQTTGFVYIYEGKKGLRRVAAMGSASGFKPLKGEAFYEKLGNRVLGALNFFWSDTNSDGNPQPDEVTFLDPKGKKNNMSVSWFDEELGVQGEGVRYEVASFRPDGVPVYRAVDTPGLGLYSRSMTKDQTLMFNQPYSGPHYNSFVDAKGNKIWEWETEGMGVHAYYRAKPFSSRQVVAEFDVVGTSRNIPGELGDIFVTNTNTGMMHIWTYDGILAGRMFRDIRDRKRESPPAIKPVPGKIDLKNTTLGQEHFHGWFGKSIKDGKHYVVMGHNFTGVAEVIGLEKAKRVNGTFTVTAKDLRATSEWEKAQARKKAYEAAKIYHCPIGEDKKVDGSLGDWREKFIHPDSLEGFEFAMHVGKENLNLAFRANQQNGVGPLLNKGGSGWQRYFKTGGAVDIMLETDPAANPKRKGPVKGDLRLLFTRTPKGLKAVLYQPTVEKPNPAEAWQAKTMVFTTDFDRVVELKNAKLAFSEDKKTGNWVLEASVPLAELGLNVKKRDRLKFDFGIMMTNKDGNEVLQRIYWSNQSTNILSDVAAEASLEPGQWGYVIFHNEGSGADGQPVMGTGLIKDDKNNDADELTEDDILNELDDM